MAPEFGQAAIGFAAMLGLVALRCPVGLAMLLVGAGGYLWIVDWAILMNYLKTTPWHLFANYTLSVIPLFILMGAIAERGGLARDLFAAANALVGHRPGGMAQSVIAACALFGAVGRRSRGHGRPRGAGARRIAALGRRGAGGRRRGRRRGDGPGRASAAGDGGMTALIAALGARIGGWAAALLAGLGAAMALLGMARRQGRQDAERQALERNAEQGRNADAASADYGADGAAGRLRSRRF